MLFFRFGWKFGGNYFICWKCILLFNILMDISIWFTTLSIFCYQTTRIKMYVLQWMVLCKIIIYYWNTFTEYRIYYTRNVTAMLGQLDSIWIIRRGGWSFNNLKIVLTVTIFDGLIILPLLFYTINLGGPGSSRWTTKILDLFSGVRCGWRFIKIYIFNFK